MPRRKRLGIARRNEPRVGDNKDYFDAAYLHYVARCKALGVDPMPPGELRALLSSANDKTDPQKI